MRWGAIRLKTNKYAQTAGGQETNLHNSVGQMDGKSGYAENKKGRYDVATLATYQWQTWQLHMELS